MLPTTVRNILQGRHNTEKMGATKNLTDISVFVTYEGVKNDSFFGQ